MGMSAVPCTMRLTGVGAGGFGRARRGSDPPRLGLDRSQRITPRAMCKAAEGSKQISSGPAVATFPARGCTKGTAASTAARGTGGQAARLTPLSAAPSSVPSNFALRAGARSKSVAEKGHRMMTRTQAEGTLEPDMRIIREVLPISTLATAKRISPTKYSRQAERHTTPGPK